MRPGSNPAPLMDPANDVVEGCFAPLDIARRALIQVTVKGLTDVCHVALLDEQPGEVRPAGLRIAKSLRFLTLDLKPQLAQPHGKPFIALAAGGLQAVQMPAEFAAGLAIEKITQEMDRLAMEPGAQLHAAHKLEDRRPRVRQRLVVAF